MGGGQVAWSLALYSGQHNVGGLTQADIYALQEIMKFAHLSPMMDVSKYPFFGGELSHPWTQSLSTFASPDLSKSLSEKYPFFAGLLKLYNDEYNSLLVDPRTNIFEQDLTEEEAKTLQTYSQGYDPQDMAKVRQYCKAVSEDKHLFWKVRQKKRSTFFACANGGCDWPLCDQLVFASEYLKMKIPKSLKWERGSWSFEVGSGTFPKLQANGLFQ